MSLKSKYETLDLAALRKQDAELAGEFEIIKRETKDFTDLSDKQYETNFNDLYDIVKDTHPEVISSKPDKPEKTAEPVIPTIPTMKVVKESEKKVEKKDKVVELPTGIADRKELLREVEECQKFVKENRPKVRDLMPRPKKPVRRSEVDLYADKITSTFKTLATVVKDESKLQKLQKATHEYISKIRSIMGYATSGIEKELKHIASIAEKRIAKAA